MQKLIVYSNVAPERADRAWTAFWFAGHALAAGVPVEVFLCGPGTELLRPENLLVAHASYRDVMATMRERGAPISVAPG